MRRIAITGMLTLVLSSCMTPSQPGSAGGVKTAIQVEAGKVFDLAVGQEARIQGSPVTVRFRSVAEDSRCPSDVQCVWAGNAVVKISLSSGEGPNSESALNTTLEPKATQYGGYTIRLVGVRPTPKSGTKIPATEYIATLEAVK